MIDLRSFCENLHDDNQIQQIMLNESEWDSIIEIHAILKPFAVVTKKLQSTNITLSDFFGMWMNLKIKVQRQSGTNPFASKIFSNMQNRHDVLIEIPVMLAAVHLDPRYNVMLTLDQKITAEDFLEVLYRRIQANDINQTQQQQPDMNPVQNVDSSLDEITLLIQQIRSRTDQNNVLHVNTDSTAINIKQLIHDFNDTEEISKSVIEYWEEKKTSKAELYQIVTVLFAIPPTQSSVERAFSALALTLTPLRTKLTDEALENMLIIRLNKSIYVE